MAKVQYVGSEPVKVPALGDKQLQPGDVVEIPDEVFEAYVPDTHCDDCATDDNPGKHPAGEHRAADHPWQGVEAPTGHQSGPRKKPAKKAAAKVKGN